MTLIEVRNCYREDLKKLYAQAEIDSIFKRCIAHFFSWEATSVGLNPHLKLSLKEEAILLETLTALNGAVPLQYVLGETHFSGLRLKVGPGVLIPRPETEELVSWILEDQNEAPKQVWDICTGSGCIAISLVKKRLKWQLMGIDLSDLALQQAQENAVLNNCIVHWCKADVLQEQFTGKNSDLIVANPPYVLPSEKKQMHANVLDHEPELALFVPEDDPLLFYRAILNIGRTVLPPKGCIYFEINPLCKDELLHLGKQLGFYALVKKDIFGKERFMKFSFTA